MSARQKKIVRELAALAIMPDDQIDFSDIPETTDWSSAVVGKFYRPIKAPVTLRLDADVLAWLRSQGPGYQTRINSILRSEMRRGSPARQRSRDKNRTVRGSR